MITYKRTKKLMKIQKYLGIMDNFELSGTSTLSPSMLNSNNYQFQKKEVFASHLHCSSTVTLDYSAKFHYEKKTILIDYLMLIYLINNLNH